MESVEKEEREIDQRIEELKSKVLYLEAYSRREIVKFLNIEIQKALHEVSLRTAKKF